MNLKDDKYDHIKKQSEIDITPEIKSKALKVLNEKKVAIFIVAFNAEKHLKQLILRIPEYIIKKFCEIFIIDDSSVDNTFIVGKDLQSKYPEYNINIYKTPFNRGYGGNQKLGYLYCIKKDYDIVILLHGDG